MLPLHRIDRDDKVPPYRQIAAQLRDRIGDGTFRTGARLPSEAQLMEHYGVARMTVREALRELASEGLTVAQHGRGVFVKARPPVRRVAADRFARRHRDGGRAAFLVEASTLGVPAVDRIVVTEAIPPAHVRELLGLPAQGRAVVRSRRYLLDGRPVELATSYLPVDIARGTPITDVNPGPGGIYARLEDLGHPLVEFVEHVSTRMPTAHECRALALGSGEPVLMVLRRAVDARGRVVEICDTVKAGNGYVLEYRIPAI
ncbi:MAG TPA: GntR family transcriptional regulator [Kineosporiaceae bacterium]